MVREAVKVPPARPIGAVGDLVGYFTFFFQLVTSGLFQQHVHFFFQLVTFGLCQQHLNALLTFMREAGPTAPDAVNEQTRAAAGGSSGSAL